MSQSPKIYGCAFVAIIIAGLLQYTVLADVHGLTVNALLAVLLTLSFFIDSVWYFLALIAEGVALFKFFPGIDRPSIAFAVTALVFFALKKFFLWRGALNTIAVIICGTLLFYAIADFHFLINSISFIGEEMAYNICAGLICYLVMRPISLLRS